MIPSFKEFITEDQEETFETPSYDIPAHNIPYLQKKIEKLNKVAAKLNCPPIKVTIGEQFMKKLPNRQNELGENEPDEYIEMHKVTVEGQPPKLDGWQFIGKLEPLDGTNEVVSKSAPGQKLPKKYQNKHSINCEHCGISRRRTASFIVKKGGVTKEVGRSCLKDFMGHANPEKYADYASMLYDLDNMVSEYRDPDMNGGGRRQRALKTDTILAAAHSFVKSKGFTSKAKSEETGFESTASILHGHFFPSNNMSAEEKKRYSIPVSKEDEEEAAKIKQFIADKKDNSEFWLNLKKFAKTDILPVQYMGYLAAAVNFYLKETGQAKQFAKEKQTFENDALGAQGEKVKFNGTVLAAHKYQSYSQWGEGTKQVVTIKADSGHLVKMFATGGDMQAGDRVTVSGRVGTAEPEKYEKSPYKGVMTTTMAPRSRLNWEDGFDPEAADKAKVETKTEPAPVKSPVKDVYTSGLHPDAYEQPAVPAKVEPKKEVTHYKKFDVIEFKREGKPNGYGIVMGTPVYGHYDVKSLESEDHISVKHDDIVRVFPK